jgi:PKD repeat protein
MEVMRLVLYGSSSYKSNFSSLMIWLLLVILIISITPLIITDSASAQNNNSPEAVISSPENGQNFAVNDVVHFDGSESSDPDNDGLKFKWDFGDGTSGTGAKTSHVYSTPWVPIISLVVSDGDLNDTARVVIVIGGGGGQNRPPSASIDSPSNFDTFTIGEIIVFDGTSSSDYEDDPLTFIWDFGDGNESTNMVTTHAYTELSPYMVSLTVSDGLFNDTERIMIFVNNTPPIADAGEDQTGYLGQELFFDGSNSSDPDILGSIDNYTWEMGDGSFKNGVTISHRFNLYGTFKVILTVTDNHGETGSDELRVIVTNAIPVAVLKINSKDIVANADLEFDASDSYDPDGSVEEYNYNFGDGTETDWLFESTVLHRYSQVGEYTASLMVRDDRNEVSKPVTIVINVVEKVNQPPSVTILYPIQGDSVAGLTKIGGQAVDPDNEIEQVEVMVDDGRWKDANIVDVDGFDVDWEFEWDTEDYSDGGHTIIARAWDGDRYSDEHSITLTVNNRPTTFIELTEDLKPDKTKPGEKVTVSGQAMYDTNVPVVNTRIEISITETNREWLTQTNEQGQYSHKITAPTDPGKYTIMVYITDGTLESETSKKLTVETTSPDLLITENDITFSNKKPKENERVTITVTIHNNGETSASGSISFYLDTIHSNNIIDSGEITVPEEDVISVNAEWKAEAGKHDIIVIITDVSPEESNLNNNQASIRITVAAGEETDEKTQESFFDSLEKLPPLYRYAIIGIVIVIVCLVIIAAAVKVYRSKKIKEPEPNGPTRPLKLEEQEPKRKPVVSAVVIVFIILGMIMFSVALTMPWYSEKIESSTPMGPMDLEGKYYLTEFELIEHNSGISRTVPWEDSKEEGFQFEQTKELYKLTQTLTIVGIVISILFLIGVIFAIVKINKKVAILFGLIALILCLATPFYFMIQHPGVVQEDYESESEKGAHKTFMGTWEPDESEDTDLLKMTWGPELGWYLTVIGSMFIILAFFISFALPKPKPRTAPVGSEKRFIPIQEPDALSGMVLFKPLDEDKDLITEKPQQVKFETIETKGTVKFESVQD